MTTELHPWLSTPDALTAARQAVSIPMNLLPGKARRIGADELESEALMILTECARPPRGLCPPTLSCARCGGSLDWVRTGAKFCSVSCRNIHAVWVQRGRALPLGPVLGAHVGSMHEWPDDQMLAYATREVGYVLNNFVRTYKLETPLKAA